MRTCIATVFAAALVLSPAPALAQDTNVANAANTAAPAPEADANLSTALPPTDNNLMATTEVPPVDDTAMTPEATPVRDRDRGIPWGLLGLLGLAGLLGRSRSSRT